MLCTNDAFLQTLAWCLKTKCSDSYNVSTLESWWEQNVAGRMSVNQQPAPKESYQEALMMITATPNVTLHSGDVLNTTAVVDDTEYITTANGNCNFEANDIRHETYGLVLLLTGAVIPIAFSLLRFIPFPTRWRTAFYAYLIDPPAFGSRHAQPVFFGTANVPTRGQAFFIFYLIGINIILSSVGYVSSQPNSWYASEALEIASYVSNRTGVLALANLPLLVLYAGRNNILLWTTNWSHPTFLLLHRWVAILCTVEACLHSAIYLQIYLNNDGYDATSESKLPYWYWGIIATICLAILLPLSLLPIRRKLYEIFLSSHIALAVLASVGCYQHIVLRFDHQWGYETWVYIGAAVWVFDRIFRILRWAQNGVKRAYITKIDDDYLRIDIPAMSASGHVYLHFPTLTWRIWENHPFSVAGITRRHRIDDFEAGGQSTTEPASEAGSRAEDEKLATASNRQASTSPSRSNNLIGGGTRGISLFVRKQGGLTSLLASKVNVTAGLPVLVESSYNSHGVTALQESNSTPKLSSNVIFIVGGVGITAILPYITSSNPQLLGGQRKLYWGVRTPGLAKAINKIFEENAHSNDDEAESLYRKHWADVEVEISVGQRLNIRSLLEADLCDQESKDSVPTTVVVCGPPDMADAVRCVVSGLVRHQGIAVLLLEESFSW
ncbi:hypothetical protein GQ53DRAFT_742402 [Thozetella sp. PMI_491]|nr:hypothetical protein GQ53DRAFT_742402 [Thozetella sp. PMI_491]